MIWHVFLAGPQGQAQGRVGGGGSICDVVHAKPWMQCRSGCVFCLKAKAREYVAMTLVPARRSRPWPPAMRYARSGAGGPAATWAAEATPRQLWGGGGEGGGRAGQAERQQHRIRTANHTPTTPQPHRTAQHRTAHPAPHPIPFHPIPSQRAPCRIGACPYRFRAGLQRPTHPPRPLPAPLLDAASDASPLLSPAWRR